MKANSLWQGTDHERQASPRAARFARAALFVSLLTMGGCIGPQVPPAPPAEPLYSEEQLDPFILYIDAGRWAVLADRAREGVALAGSSAEGPPSPALELDAPYSADEIERSLNRSLASLVSLVGESCEAGLATAEQCSGFVLPDWFGKPVGTGAPDMATLRARSDWIGEHVFTFIEAPCRLGEERTGDYLFCSVE